MARVSIDEGQTWNEFPILVTNPNLPNVEGAFNYADRMGGGVIIELLGDASLNQPFSFTGMEEGTSIHLTLRSSDPTADNPTLTKAHADGSMITFAPIAGGSLTVQNVNFNGGGIFGCAEADGGIFNISSNTASPSATFENCYFGFFATIGYGGAIYATSPSLSLTDCSFYGMINPLDEKPIELPISAGGAICYENSNGTLTMTNCNILYLNCVGSNGSGSTGGGIFVDGTATLSNVYIADCSAYEGSAIYSFSGSDEYALTLKNGTRITGNRAIKSTGPIYNPFTQTTILPSAGSAVYMSGILTLGDSNNTNDIITINGNYATGAGGRPANLRLCTTNGVGLRLLSQLTGEICIANPGGNGAQFGVEPNNIVSHAATPASVFKSDITNRDAYSIVGGEANTFYWRSYVCKITDASGNKLGLYSSLSEAVSAFTSVSGAKNIEMLVEEHSLGSGITIPATMTLKTAAKMWGPETYGFPADAAEDCATIKRGYNGRRLFTLDNASRTFTLENITLDGGSNSGLSWDYSHTISSPQGGLVYSSGNLYVYGCTLQNSSVTGYHACGGAIYTSSGTLEIGAYQYDDGGKTVTKCTTIKNCLAYDKGGGLYISYGASISNTNIINCKATGDNGDGYGGGIYFSNNSSSVENVLENCSICDNSAKMGGGIYSYANKSLHLRGNTRVENNKTTNTTGSSGLGGGIHALTIIVGVVGESSNNVNIKDNTTLNGEASNLSFNGLPDGRRFIILNSKMDGHIFVNSAPSSMIEDCKIGEQYSAYLNDPDDIPHIHSDNGVLSGYTAPDYNTNIKWRKRVVCKITDDGGHILSVGGTSALYSTVAAAFTALSDGTAFTLNGATATPAYVKMIADHSMVSQVNITDNLRYDITLTTAGTADASNPYTPPTGTNSTRATLYDGALGGKPNFNITCTQHTLTVKGLNFDGRSGPDQETVPQIVHGMFRVDGDNNTNIAYPQLILVNDNLMNFNATGSGAGWDTPAVYMINGAKVEVQSGTVFKNCKALHGGAIECRDSQLTMTGGEITGCNAIYYGGAISFNISGNSTFNVSGLVKISNNTKGSAKSVTPDNVHFYDANGVVNIVGNGLECGSRIGVSYLSGTNIENKTIATGTSANCLEAFRKGYLFDDSQTYKPYCLNYGSYSDNNIYLVKSWSNLASNTENDITTNGSTITVHTAEGLAYIAKTVNEGNDLEGKTILLDSDLNLGTTQTNYPTDGKLWVPIGMAGDDCSNDTDTIVPFKGTFDGQGHTITGLTSYLPHKAMGLFGAVGQGGEVKNVFIEGGTNTATYVPESTETACVGGLVGQLLGGTVAYSESTASLISDVEVLEMGGLVGNMTSGTVHSNMAMSNMTGSNSTMGGLVGNLAGGTVANSFANALMTVSGTSVVGGLVGTNGGTVTNCYTRLRNETAPSNFGWIAGTGSGTVTNCYIPDGNSATGCATYTATNLSDGKYGFGGNGQVVGNSTLVDVLNTNASGTYAKWTRTMASPINGDYPVLMLGDNICLGSKANSNFIDYAADLNSMISNYNNANGGNIYLYDVPSEVTTNTSSNVRVYINEDLGILQGDNNTLNARASVTIKNTTSNAKEGASADWHMFSSAISNAPLGIVYHTSEDETYMTNVANKDKLTDAVWSNSDPPMTTWSTTNVGYFPTNTPYGTWRGTAWDDDSNAIKGFFDLYTYSEENYHWMNLKREGTASLSDHWHTDKNKYGYHYKINYTNGTTMPAGKGYLLALSSESMLMADGVLNNGTVTVNVTKSDADAYIPVDGYTPDAKFRSINLVGNPYQSYLDFDAFASTNDKLESTYATRSGGEYIYYTANASSNREYTASQYVHPHQGFFVRVSDEQATGSYTVTFDNTMRLAGTSEQYSSSYRGKQNYLLVNLLCYDAEGHRDLTTVEVNRPEQGGGHKMEGLRTAEGTLAAQLGTELFQTAFVPEGTNEVPVRFEAYSDGEYTIRWNTLHGEFSYLHLIDNMTGADVDMLVPEPVEGPAGYTFTARTTDYKSRFKLVFDASQAPEPVEGPSTFAYFDGSEWVITNGNGATVQLVDVMGRVLRSTDGACTVSTSGYAPGVYVLRLISGESVKTQKIVIR